MNIAINILNNHLRKDEKIMRRYKRDGNEIGYNGIKEHVDQLKKALEILNCK